MVAVARREEERDRLIFDEVGLLAQAAADHAANPLAGDFFKVLLHHAGKATSGSNDNDGRWAIRHTVIFRREFLGADQTFGTDAEQGGDLRDDAGGERPQAVFCNQSPTGGDDQLQTPAAGIKLADLVVGTDGGGDRGVQPGSRQFILGLVIVDVVIADCRQLRGIAGLPGTQDDARIGLGKIMADALDKTQAGIFAFHDNIKQDDSDVALGQQNLLSLCRRVGMQEFKRMIEDVQSLQGKSGGLVDIFVIVDDEDSPNLCTTSYELRITFVDEGQQFIFTMHLKSCARKLKRQHRPLGSGMQLFRAMLTP